MLEERDWARLARYAAGETTPQETAEVERWLEEDPSRLGFAWRPGETLRPGWRRWGLRAAAAVVLAAGGSALWLWQRDSVVPAAGPTASREYVTPPGQRATF